MGTIYDTKGKAKKFLHKLFDSHDKHETKPAPAPPPKPVYLVTKPVGAPAGPRPNARPNENLVSSFDALSIAAASGKPYDSDFVGGFYPPVEQQHHVRPHANTLQDNRRPHQNYAPGSNHVTPPHSYIPQPLVAPPPPQLHSMTMQHALGFQGPQTTPYLSPYFKHTTRPASESYLTTHGSAPSPSPPCFGPPVPAQVSQSGVNHAQPAGPLRPPPATPPRRRRASSTPPRPTLASSPSSRVYQIQCSGTAKSTGKRCTRLVKVSPALSKVTDVKNAEDDEPEVFCFQHSKVVLDEPGMYARKNGAWIDFKDWIPPYLAHDTQASLRAEMEKSKSSSDVPGYIYTYEIRDSKAPTIKLKIGRAVNLVKRVDQWSKQCASKEQVLRGWYPGTVDPDDDADGGDSRMRGRARAGPKGPLCHRLERLIHLELADLAVSGVYLNPRWPRVQAPPGTASGANGIGNGGTKPCVDCGQLHKEIFGFQRITSGRNKGREFETIVQPVIEKWGKFVETYV